MHIRTFFTSFIVTALLLPSVAYAAQLSVEPGATPEGPGFRVQVVAQYDRAINALEGSLRFDPSFMRISRVIESPSGVPLWIERPRETSPGVFSFAGIFPGGIEPLLSNRIVVLDITFEALKTGTTEISISDARVLLHAATPTEDELELLPITVRIDGDDIGVPVIPEDTQEPEDFDIHVSSDTGLYAGDTVALYLARDMQSGVDTYELREKILGVFGVYRQTDSPSTLSPMWRWSIIEVRATDRAGNAAVARYVPKTLVAMYVLFGLLIGWRVRRTRRRRA